MDEQQGEIGGRPEGLEPPFLIGLRVVAVLFGVAALVLAVTGWWVELPNIRPKSDTPMLDVAMRSIKALLLSDIYYDDRISEASRNLLEWARTCGILAVLLGVVRTFFLNEGSQFSRDLFRWRLNKHDVVIGKGPAAENYARAIGLMFGKRKAAYLAPQKAPITKRVVTFERRGNLKDQLRVAKAKRANRIVVDEGDDSETWRTAQVIARLSPNAEVVAHIADPWQLDQLRREQPHLNVSAFSYAGGVARQLMLAHPPYLLAERLGAEAQHILIVGFGQVGQSLAREFIVTCVSSVIEPMMITIVDPDGEGLQREFETRHGGLMQHVDIAFIAGDFRRTSPAIVEAIRERTKKAEICAAYVSVPDGQSPSSVALDLRMLASSEALFRCPIFFCGRFGLVFSNVRQGVGRLGEVTADQTKLEQQAQIEGRIYNLRITSFGAWTEAFDGAGLLEGQLDGQARRLHAQYTKLMADKAKQANPAAPAPDTAPWELLPDQLRVSNRRAAAHIRAKTHSAGFDLGAWLDSRVGGWRSYELPPAAGVFHTDDPLFMKKMARLEHQRWLLDRFLDGWKLGPRDNYKRQRSDLVPFEQLDAAAVHKDDEVIKTTKALLEGSVKRGRRS